MATHLLLHPESHRRHWVAGLLCLGVAGGWALLGGAQAAAQTRSPVHQLHHEFLPPGVIGRQQLLRHPGMPGYFQAVELRAPSGTKIAVLASGGITPPSRSPVLVGMQLGYVYSLKLTELPHRPGLELFPSVELVNRLFPPEGTKTRFPVPIEISEEDILQAASGLFVTRVIYLEDPDQALPVADAPNEQRVREAAPDEDPLHIADRLGRPMAILRLGSRVPDQDGDLSTTWPPLQVYPSPTPAPVPRGVDQALERQPQDIPRRAEGPSEPLPPSRATQRPTPRIPR